VPVINHTPKTQERDNGRAQDPGPTQYNVKTLQPNQLLARLRRLVKARP
jgi:DNA-binding response OmpR family regulator